MIHFLALALFLVACNASSASTPRRNLVCERVSLLNTKAQCLPELSGDGPLISHSARVTLQSPDGKQSTEVCGLNAGQLAMVCDGLVVAPKKAD